MTEGQRLASVLVMPGVGSKLRPWRARQAAAAKDPPEAHPSRVTPIPPWAGPLQLIRSEVPRGPRSPQSGTEA